MTGNFRGMPSDFHDHAGEGIEKLMKRYHAGAEVVRRWKGLCGTLRPWGRSVIRTDEEGKAKKYQNVKAAAVDMYAGGGSNIYRALHSGAKAYGYYWQYCED